MEGFDVEHFCTSDGFGFEHPPCGRFDFEHVSTWDVLTSKVLHMEGVDLEQVFTWGVWHISPHGMGSTSKIYPDLEHISTQRGVDFEHLSTWVDFEKCSTREEFDFETFSTGRFRFRTCRHMRGFFLPRMVLHLEGADFEHFSMRKV